MRRRWHRLLYRIPFGWRYRWQKAYRERPVKKSTGTLELADHILKAVWGDPKVEVSLDLGSQGFLERLMGWPTDEHAPDVTDPDWWEPRYDNPSRRMDARMRGENV